MGKPLHILAVPYPAQGHVTPLIEFSHQLLDHRAKITFVNTDSIHKKIVSNSPDHKNENEKNMIRFVSIPDELNLKDDSIDLQNPVDAILKSISVHVKELLTKIDGSGEEKVDLVLVDATLGQTLEDARRFGITGVAFWPASLGVLAFMLHIPKLIEAGDIDDTGTPMKEEVITLPLGMPAMKTIDSMWGFSDNPIMQKMMFSFIFGVSKAAKVAKYIICNSFNELEPDSHASIPNVLTVGPLLERPGLPNGQLLAEDATCLTWLDHQPEQSVTYIAFGSTTIFDQNQFDELLHGLKLLHGPFLWVFRPGLTSELSTSDLDVFKDGIHHHGKVVEWAPQQKVLAHPSIVCFITHCGWNSTIEAVNMGVPLLCWPYVADQFHNQNYICDIWKIGLKFKKDDSGIITRSEISTRVKELLGNEGIQSRASKLKDMGRRNIIDGGTSSKNFNDFINAIKS